MWRRYNAAMSAFQPLTQHDFHHTLADTPGVALVLFTGPHCSSCRAWRERLAAMTGADGDWRLFEVDVERDTGLAREFEVFHLPALFVYLDGEFHGELQCEARPAAIRAAVAALLQRPAQEAP